MAVTPTKPSFMDVTSRGKIRVWESPVVAVTSDTLTVPGVKKVFSVSFAKTGTITWTSSFAANGNGVVLTLAATASSTGDRQPLVVYGQ